MFAFARSGRSAFAMALVALPAVVLANGTALPDTLSVAMRPGDTTSLALEANFGFLEAADGQSFDWICHETLLPGTSSITPIYFEGSGQSLLVTVRSLGIAHDPDHSLFHSADGCDWAPASGLTGVLIRHAAFDPSNPSRVLAASSTGSGASNGIWISSDGGVTWAQTSLNLSDRFFRTVEFARSNPQVAWASATWYMPSSAWIYRTGDGGTTWNEIAWTFEAGDPAVLQTQLDVAAISPTDENTAYFRTDGSTDYLLLTTNGGASFEEVFSLPDDIRGVAWAPDGSVWIAARQSGSFRSEDGRNFSLIESGPKARHFYTDTRGMFSVANNYDDGYALGIATGGTGFTGLFRFDELTGTRECPTGTDVATVCDPLWPALAQRLGIGSPSPSPSPSPTSGDDDDDGGCRCDLSTGPAATFAWAGFGLVAFLGGATLFRRRRGQAFKRR